MAKKTANLKDRDLMGKIGDRFKTARKAASITHEKLSMKTGVERFSIGRFENGKRGMDAAALVAVLHAAAENGVDLNFVFTGKRDAALEETLRAFRNPNVLGALEAIAAAHAATKLKPVAGGK